MRALRYLLVTLLFFGHISGADAIIIRAEMVPTLDEVDAPVWPGKIVSVSVPRGTAIVHMGLGNGRDFKPKRVSARLLEFEALREAEPTNVNITLKDGRHVTIRFYAATSEPKHASRVEFYEPGTMPNSLEVAAEDLGIGRWITAANRVDVPREISWQDGAHELILRTGYIVHTDDAVLFPLALSTEGDSYSIQKLLLLDHLDRTVDVTLIYAEHDLLTENAVVRHDRKIVAAFRINKPHQISKGWTLIAVPATRLAPARFDWRERRQRGPLEDKVAISVHAMGGRSKLDDGAGNDETAWGSPQGFGLRVTKDVAKHMSIQGAFDITWTNGVMFNDATWGPDRGDLRVDETAGRVLASGLLHTAGKRWVPYGQLALGARFSNHKKSMAARDESEYRSAFLGGVGGGLHVLLGKRMMVALSGIYTAPLGGDDTTTGFELAIGLAGVWSTGPAR